MRGLAGCRAQETVEVNQVSFASRLLRASLAAAGSVFPDVLTVGPEAEVLISSLTVLLTQCHLAAIGKLFLYSVIEAFQTALKGRHGLKWPLQMDAGFLPDWPMVNKLPLLSVLGNIEQWLGVTLSTSFRMFPGKPTSGILFLHRSILNCRLSSRLVCISRKVDSDPRAASQRGISGLRV